MNTDVRALTGFTWRCRITHTEMARMIALSRESVNRAWNEFRREGIIVGDKDDWIVSREWFDRFRR